MEQAVFWETPRWHWPCKNHFRAPGAPRERQPVSIGLYSGTMIMPTPYRPPNAPVLNPANGGASGFGAAVFQQGGLRPSSRKNSIMWNSVGIMLNFAPFPASPTRPPFIGLFGPPAHRSPLMAHFPPDISGELPAK